MRARLLIALLLALALAACGYRHVSDSRTVLPEDVRSLHITNVENVTLRTDLPARLRALFRDEITKRQGLSWAGRETADGLVQLSIDTFDLKTRVEGGDDETLKFDALITLQAVIHDRLDRARLWDSGPMTVTRSFVSAEDQAVDRALELAVRRMVDRLYEAY
jgi:hypothetical protein